MKYTHLLLVLIATLFTSSCYQLNNLIGNSYVLRNPSQQELDVLNNDSKNVRELKIEVEDFEDDNENVNLDFSNLQSFVNLEKFYLSVKVEKVYTVKGLEFLLTSTRLNNLLIYIDNMSEVRNLDITDTMQIIEKLTTLESLILTVDSSKWSNQFDVSKLTNLQEFEFNDLFKVNIVGLDQLTGITKFTYSIGTSQAQFQYPWSPKFLYDLQYLTNLKSLQIFIDDKAAIIDFGFFNTFKHLPQVTHLDLSLAHIIYCDNLQIGVEEQRCAKEIGIKSIDFLTNISYLTSLVKLKMNLEDNYEIKDWSALEIGIFPLENLQHLEIYAPYNSHSLLDTGIDQVKKQFDKKYKGHLNKYSFYI